MFRNAGLPSLAVTFSVISMPSTSLPRQVLFGSVIRRTRPGFCVGQRLHLGLVVRERAVGRRGRSAGRERRSPRAARRRRARAALRRRGRRPARASVKPASRSVAGPAAPCRTTPSASRAAVLGHVEAERDAAGPCPRASGVLHAHELRRVRARLRGVAGSPASWRDASAGPPRGAASAGRPAGSACPAASTSSPCATSWASGEAAAATARPVGVEQRDVPVAVAAFSRTST